MSFINYREIRDRFDPDKIQEKTIKKSKMADDIDEIKNAISSVTSLRNQLLSIQAQLKTIYNKDTKNCFLIDYENIGSTGLIGCENLTNSDYIRVYYSKLNQKSPANAHKIAKKSPASVEYKQVNFCMKNALDITLLNDIIDEFLYMNIHNLYIVSNDTDFDKPIEDLKKDGVRVHRITKISDIKASGSSKNKNTPRLSKDYIEIFCEKEFKGQKWQSKIETIVNIIYTSNSRKQILAKLAKQYGGKNPSKIMTRIEPLLSTLDNTNERRKKSC